MNKRLEKALVQSQFLLDSKRAKALEQVLMMGDLKALDEGQRLNYIEKLCRATGVSILFRPFDYIVLNNKLVLYANRSCTDQLRHLHKISIKIVSREKIGDLYVVTADASGPKGKTDSSIGAMNITGLRGQELANAMMKAETKAKRRVTLSICGLGILDEIEARELAEKEAKEVAQEAVIEVEEKVQASEERPEFESIRTPILDSEPGSQPQATTIGSYILQAGKLKGKVLKDLPLAKLATWMNWFNSKTNEERSALHLDIQTDAFYIFEFLEHVRTIKMK